jgi:hypothetical protein
MLAFTQHGVFMLRELIIPSRNGKEIGVNDRLLMLMATLIVFMNRMNVQSWEKERCRQQER